MSDKAPEVDFDHHSTEYARDPWAVNIALNSSTPVAHSSHHGGFWLVTGYDQAAQVAHQPELFSSAHEVPNVEGRPQGTVVPASSFRGLPLEIDPPEFLAWRRALNGFFSPPAARKLRPRIQRYATWCVDRCIADGEIDLVLDLSNPVPALITLDMVGLPLDDWEIYAEAVHALVYTLPGTPEFARVEAGFAQLVAEVRELIPKRRAQPGDDLLSFLTQLEIEGEPISDEDIVAVCNAVIPGGVDTTTALLANTFDYLDRNREARRRLIESPELIPRVCDEFLRYYTPVMGAGRTVMADTTIDGCPVGKGERVLLSWAAANLDAKMFADPEVIDLDRDAHKQAAFGLGIHRCIGRHIARMDFEVMVGEVLRRMPDYQIVAGAAEKYPTVGQINGYVKMPARFTPGPRIGPAAATAAALSSSMER
ncbi:cytochrome P450 [Nocardia tenerifensis]|uniref:Cytochrome P450 n=1 Tax=Nocardia tenerifensis TaxID=228006 RepID=A0A318K4Y2_9NOCA|nr:cytochrome P450 [Nocardia tenerifensis]PXX58033.1 cytochrome P450 [Nocardia tenerifensis]